MSNKSKLGTIGWFDLTVNNAEEISEFYSHVVGWKAEKTPVSDYHDFTMNQVFTNDPLSGICHKRGENSDLPSQWLLYIYVDDLDARTAAVLSSGGKVLKGPTKPSAYGRFSVIEDPAGAVLALFEESVKSTS